MNKLTEAEERFMKAVWDSGDEPTRTHIVKILAEDYNMDVQPATVSAYVMKLKSKGYLHATTKGKYNKFQILVTEDEYMQEKLRWFFEYLYNSDKERFLHDVKCLTEK